LLMSSAFGPEMDPARQIELDPRPLDEAGFEG